MDFFEAMTTTTIKTRGTEKRCHEDDSPRDDDEDTPCRHRIPNGDNEDALPVRRKRHLQSARAVTTPATHAIIQTYCLLSLLLAGLLSGVSCLEMEYRSYDGWDNNLMHPEWGSTDSPRVRKFPPASAFYNDNHHEPMDEVNSNLPSARRVMEEIFRKVKPHEDKTSSHLLLEFGHFMVQDILGSRSNSSEPFPVPCDGNLTDYVFCPATGMAYPSWRLHPHRQPENDTEYDDDDDGMIVMPFYRDNHYLLEGNQQRATINHMTSFLDLSNIYGLNEVNSTNLRKEGGVLMLEEDGLASIDNEYLTEGMKSGMNTSPGAYAIYIVFMRYHNLLAAEYRAADPSLSDDAVFEMARRKVIAVYQSIVEEKYIPTLLGDKLATYQGYNPSVDPSIDEFFASVSFRYAHSSFSSLIRIVDAQFHGLPSDPLLLRDVFKQNVPTVIRANGGVEPFLRGLAVTPAKAVDASFVEDMNLWAEATSVLDVQRGRDHGIPRYNDVREMFGLERVSSMEELVMGHNSSVAASVHDKVLVDALERLYHNNVDLVDAYVGGLAEAPNTSIDNMGPVFTLSLKEQFTRLRDGDRFWYKNTFPEEEYLGFPSLSDLIKMVCVDMDVFPEDDFLTLDAAADASGGGDGACDASAGESNQLSFLGGEYTARWHVDQVDETETTIDVTLTVLQPMEGAGYIGIGWNARQMKGADIWFCTVNEGLFRPGEPPAAECPANGTNSVGEPMFSCCLAEGTHHEKPQCSSPGDGLYYQLDVVDWCLAQGRSSVTVRTVVCADDVETATDCFMLSSTSDGKMDMIVAYNLVAQSRPHGYQRRTNAQVDIQAGILTESEAGTADPGLIATHGVFMLFGWMILAPWGVFIVRYMKTRKWRLVAHISIMSFVGSMMVPLLIGVEASVGASDKTAEHALVGLIIMGVFFLMAGTGRFRYLKWQGQKIGKKTDFVTMIFHKYGGVAFIAIAWWNCYTGLVRIGPEDSNIELVLFSSVSMGYDIDIFGYIRKYFYGPYIAFVGVVFLVAEIRKRRLTKAQMKMERAGSLWDDDGSDLDTMTMATFLDVTRLGNSLCVVDGRVLDVTDFIDSHPGGPDFLRYVRGSDITEEFLGHRDVDGKRHAHSEGALSLMKKFVKARLIEIEDTSGLPSSKLMESAPSSPKLRREGVLSLRKSLKKILQIPGTGSSTAASQAFRRGKVVDVRYLAPASSVPADESKPVILLRLSLPRCKEEDFKAKDVARIPGATFRFRGIDRKHNMFEREYTALLLNRESLSTNTVGFSLLNLGGSSGSLSTPFAEPVAATKTDDEEKETTFDFVISLIPGGHMSNFIKGLKAGKLLLAQGPKCNPRTLEKVESRNWKTVVLLAAGTGVVPMIQLIDYYVSSKARHCPPIFLIWILKSSAYNYYEELGLQERVKRSRGRLKWVTFYSSSLDTDQAEPEPKKSFIGSLADEVARTSGLAAIRPSVLDPIRASVLHHLRPSVLRVSNHSTRPMKSLIWKKQKPRVQDLIAYAQHDDSISHDTDFAPGNDFVEFDQSFWEKNCQFISRQVDRQVVEELLVSIEACSRHCKAPRWHESVSDVSSSGSEEDLVEVARVLRGTVTVSNREDTTGTLHSDCFLGKEAVDCFVSLGYEPSRRDGVKMGQALLRGGLIKCVSWSTQWFSDDGALFKFTIPPVKDDEEAEESSAVVPPMAEPADLKDEERQDDGLEKRVTLSNHSTPPSMEPIPEQSQQTWGKDEDENETEEHTNNEDTEIEIEGDANASFEDMFVAVSGSPMFETNMVSMLRGIGLTREQTLTFAAAPGVTR